VKILHVIDSGGLYGAEKMLLGLAAACCRLGHAVTVGTIVAPQDEGDALGDAAASRGLAHRQFCMKDGLNLGGAREILRYADQQGFDIIHAHGYKANILLSLVPGRRRQRMVCTLHGWASVGRHDRLWFYETLDRLLLWRFDRVVTVSQPMSKIVSRYVADDRLSVIPNGIELPVRRGEADGNVMGARPRHAQMEAVRILAIGRLSYEKGFDQLVEATRILSAGGMKLLVTIAGEGPCRAELERQIAASGLDEQVSLLGYVADVDKLYQNSDLFVLCSRTEGLPLVLLEAMSRSLPVIATPVGEVAVVLGHGQFGCVLNDADPQTLADGIRRVTGSPDAAETAFRASVHVRAEYSVEKMAARYCRVYAARMGETVGGGQ
jgi:glycosyltransferase involved in cell wall biosynthesis